MAVAALCSTTLFFALIGVTAAQFGEKLVSGGCRSDSDCVAYPNTVCLKSYGSCLADPNSAGFCVCSPTHPRPIYAAFGFSQPPASCTNDTFSAAGGNCTTHATECGCADTYQRFNCHWKGYCECGSMFGVPTANGLDCVRNVTAAALNETCQTGADCATKGARCDWNQALFKMVCGCDGIFIEINGVCKIPELGDPCQSDHKCSKGFASVSCVNNMCGCKAGETHIAKAFRFRTDYIDGIRHSHFPYAYDYLATCANTSLLSTMFAAPENGTCFLNSTHVLGCQPNLVCETCGFLPGSTDDLEGICVKNASDLQAPGYQNTCYATPMPQLPGMATTIPPAPTTVTGSTSVPVTGAATTATPNTATTGTGTTATVTSLTATTMSAATATVTQGSTASVATATAATPATVAGTPVTGTTMTAATVSLAPRAAGTTGTSNPMPGTSGTGTTVTSTTGSSSGPIATAGTPATGSSSGPIATAGTPVTGSSSGPIATAGTPVTGSYSGPIATAGTPAMGSSSGPIATAGTSATGSSAAATAMTASGTTGITANSARQGNTGSPPLMSSTAGLAIASSVALLSAWRIILTG